MVVQADVPGDVTMRREYRAGCRAVARGPEGGGGGARGGRVTINRMLKIVPRRAGWTHYSGSKGSQVPLSEKPSFGALSWTKRPLSLSVRDWRTIIKKRFVLLPRFYVMSKTYLGQSSNSLSNDLLSERENKAILFPNDETFVRMLTRVWLRPPTRLSDRGRGLAAFMLTTGLSHYAPESVAGTIISRAPSVCATLVRKYDDRPTLWLMTSLSVRPDR